MSIEVDAESHEVTAKRPIRRSGNSLVVSIPPELLHAAGLELGDSVTLALSDNGGIEMQLEEAG